MKQSLQIFKRFLLIGVTSFLFFGFRANGQVFQWAEVMGGTSNDYGLSITLDSNGNVYTTGYFEGTADFNPGAGIYSLTSAGSYDIFISKLDTAGNFIWAKRIGGSSDDIGYSIAVDDYGNTYTVGYFKGTVDFNPGAGIFNLTSAGTSDIFVTKLDPSGNFLWAKRLNGVSNIDIGTSIAIDLFGNVIITGYFNLTLYNSQGNVSAHGKDDIFISKLDSLGNFLWTRGMGGNYYDRGYYVTTDAFGNIYSTGIFEETSDFDPGSDTFNLNSSGGYDAFISKLDSSGNFIWAKQLTGIYDVYATSIVIDNLGYIYITGKFYGTVDFDPGSDTFNLVSSGSADIFLTKFDSLGNFIWAINLGGTGADGASGLAIDDLNNIYATGSFQNKADFDPGPDTFNLYSNGTLQYTDIFIFKIDSSGSFVWAINIGSTANGGAWEESGRSIILDKESNIYSTGYFYWAADFDPRAGTSFLFANGIMDAYALKMAQRGTIGSVFSDVNGDCIKDFNEIGLLDKKLIINPGNLIAETNNGGEWYVNSLPIGTYAVTVDTSGKWQATCPPTQTFTITASDSIFYAPSFGFISTEPCASPEISIQAPILRRCFSNQKIYVQACNQINATGVLDSAYVDVELDNLLTVQSATLAYTMLGNNVYRFNVGILNPGMCTNFSISCSVSCNATTGQTLCMEAHLYPADSCAFDTIPDTGSTCTTQWDNSSLTVEGSCLNDSIRFVIYNTGDSIDGDMTCYSPVRIYIDGELMFLDSVQLGGGDSIILIFSGDGRTWRLEADQHPLHPGNSHPNSTVELCGDSTNWTSGLVNTFPMDDAEPVTDIYCGMVTGSSDPNDKAGYPIGLTDSNFISPNQQLQYVIRFQNTGTDTAFSVVIRDTLDTNLNIFSVVPGVASHNYSFKMYGPHVLEWTFDNILLPDSNANEPASHGFVTFKVNQNPNLPNGTIIKNSSAIYFDFNSPVITNQTLHTINKLPKTLNFTAQSLLTETACSSYFINGFSYSSSGTYFQKSQSSEGVDSLITLNLTVNPSPIINQQISICNGDSIFAQGNYQTIAGTYLDTLSTIYGCDSVIVTILTVNQSPVINQSAAICSGDSIFLQGNYQAIEGTYHDTLLTLNGCDSVIFTSLTVNPSPIINQQFTICNGDSIFLQNNYQIAAGTYYDTLSTVYGCDSIIVTTLTVNQPAANSQQLEICSGDSIYLQNTYQVNTGTYYDTLYTIYGCDSVVVSTLVVNESPIIGLQAFVCNGDSIFLQGNYQTIGGIYYNTLSTVKGCDSVIATTLTVNPAPVSNWQLIICSGDSILWQGNYLSATGTYYDTLSTVNGCDSVLITTLSVKQTSLVSQQIEICSGDSVLLQGSYRTMAGEYYDTLSTVNGCDSVIATNLIVKDEITLSQTLTLCSGESLIVGANTYNTSGTYTDILTAYNGCDSTVITDLTVNDPITFSQSLNICAGESITVGSNTYNTAGTYTDVLMANNGCDSTVITNLTLKDTITFSQSLVICAGESITVGSNTYNTAGTYTDVLTASNGCDSIVTTNLTVKDTISFLQSLNICAGDSVMVGTSTYYLSGTYTNILTASNGCDSTVITNLTVENNIDVTVSANGATLTANTSNAIYQWIDCDNGNTAISNETNQSYTATVNGNYAVIIIKNSCSDTSTCINVSGLDVGLSIKENVKFMIYPNPTGGNFTVEISYEIRKNYEIQIFDAKGGLVYQSEINSKIAIPSKNWMKGNYFVNLVEEGKMVARKKVVVE